MRVVLSLCLSLFLICQASLASTLGGFDSYSEAEKSLLGSVVNQLGISDSQNTIKEKIYDKINMALGGDWYSYWIGLNDLSGSEYNGGSEKGFIQLLLSTDDSGSWIITFSKKPDVGQVIVSMAQVRHGSQEGALSVYNKQKNDGDRYDIKSEAAKYAFIQENGKVSFTMIDVASGTGSVTYVNQFLIDL